MRTSRSESPALTDDQVEPEFMLFTTPVEVAAYTVDDENGSTFISLTIVPTAGVYAVVQLSPLLVVL